MLPIPHKSASWQIYYSFNLGMTIFPIDKLYMLARPLSENIINPNEELIVFASKGIIFPLT